MLKWCKVSHLTKEEVFNVNEYYVGEMVGCIFRMSADAIVTVVRAGMKTSTSAVRNVGQKVVAGIIHMIGHLDANHRGDNETESRGGNELTRQRDNIMGGSNMRRKDEIMVRPETVMLQLVTK